MVAALDTADIQSHGQRSGGTTDFGVNLAKRDGLQEGRHEGEANVADRPATWQEAAGKEAFSQSPETLHAWSRAGKSDGGQLPKGFGDLQLTDNHQSATSDHQLKNGDHVGVQKQSNGLEVSGPGGKYHMGAEGSTHEASDNNGDSMKVDDRGHLDVHADRQHLHITQHAVDHETSDGVKVQYEREQSEHPQNAPYQSQDTSTQSNAIKSVVGSDGKTQLQLTDHSGKTIIASQDGSKTIDGQPVQAGQVSDSTKSNPDGSIETTINGKPVTLAATDATATVNSGNGETTITASGTRTTTTDSSGASTTVETDPTKKDVTVASAQGQTDFSLTTDANGNANAQLGRSSDGTDFVLSGNQDGSGYQFDSANLWGDGTVSADGNIAYNDGSSYNYADNTYGDTTSETAINAAGADYAAYGDADLTVVADSSNADLGASTGMAASGEATEAQISNLAADFANDQKALSHLFLRSGSNAQQGELGGAAARVLASLAQAQAMKTERSNAEGQVDRGGAQKQTSGQTDNLNSSATATIADNARGRHPLDRLYS